MDTRSLPLASAGMRKMAVIGPAAFLNSLAIGSLNLGLIFIVKEVFGAAPSVVGKFGALWSFVYFFSCLAFRKLTARLVPRASMTFMVSVSAAVFLIFCVFPSLSLAFAAYAVFGASIAFFWPPLMGWLSRGMEGHKLSRATGLFNFSWSFGGILSPFTAGALSERGKFLPIYFAITLFTLNAIFISLSRTYLKDADERPARIHGAVYPVQDESSPLRYSAWVSVVALYVALGVMSNIFPMFARTELGLSESRTGLLITVRAAATTAGFIFFGRFSFWRFRGGLLILPTAIIAASGILLAFTASSLPLLVAGLVATGFAASWSYNNSMFYGASGAPDRDRRMTTHEALVTAGQVLGSLVGGYIYQTGSMRLVFLFMAFLAILVFGIQVLMTRSRFGEAQTHRPPSPR